LRIPETIGGIPILPQDLLNELVLHLNGGAGK
jgi:hypothetical protein